MLLSSRAGLSAVAGPRMRESPSTPAAMQSLLRYFHPSWAGRSRVASAEKHLCARGTALWTHIRNLVCKGKVGCGGLRRPQGCIGAGSLLPGCQLRSPVLGSRGKRGSVVTALWEEREGHLLQNMLVSLSKTLSGCADSPFPGVQEEQRLPPFFLGGQDTEWGSWGTSVLPSPPTMNPPVEESCRPESGGSLVSFPSCLRWGMPSP